MGWLRGFEPPTTGITIQYSNQLSYSHHWNVKLRAPGRTRTCNRRLRRPVLYPVELRARGEDSRIVPAVAPSGKPGWSG